jgi:hypothetical protein
MEKIKRSVDGSLAESIMKGILWIRMNVWDGNSNINPTTQTKMTMWC